MANCNFCKQEHGNRKPPHNVCEGCDLVAFYNMDNLGPKQPRISVRARLVGLLTAQDVKLGGRGQGKIIG